MRQATATWGDILKPGPAGSTPTSAGGARPGDVPNYLVQAILVTIFCCLPFGIVAIVFAAQVNGKLERGDREGALRASSTAKLWSWISFGVGLSLLAAIIPNIVAFS